MTDLAPVGPSGLYEPPTSAVATPESEGTSTTMNDNYISRDATIAASLWALAVALVIATWLCAILNAPHRWVSPIAITAVLAMALATIAQTRLYVLRTCGLIRVSAGLETPDADVHSIDGQRTR